MKKLSNIIDSKIVVDLMNLLEEDKKLLLKDFVLNLPDNFTRSKCISRIKIFYNILVNNDSNYLCLYDEYFTKLSTKDKICIKYGKTKLEEFKTKLSNRKMRENYDTCLTISFWLKKGYSENEAKNKISEMQKNNNKKAQISKKINKPFPPNSILHWTNKGYSIEDANVLRMPFVNKSIQSKKNMIKRYGKDEGIKRFDSMYAKRANTNLKKYGRKSTVCGYVSKESLFFFKKLYKKIRKLGIKREDVYWGICGSKEFATYHEENNYFYDFTIKSLKIIIEYNNVFWHPKIGTIWRNPYINEETAKEKDILKEKIMVDRGFKMIVVWNDEDIDAQLDKIVDIICERLQNDS